MCLLTWLHHHSQALVSKSLGKKSKAHAPLSFFIIVVHFVLNFPLPLLPSSDISKLSFSNSDSFILLGLFISFFSLPFLLL